MSMKGMELPINMIVVVLIAVLVLVTVGAFLAGQLGSGTGAIGLEQAFGDGCQKLRTIYNCQLGADVQVTSYTLQGDQPGTPAPLFGSRSICSAKGLADNECARSCGCNNVLP